MRNILIVNCLKLGFNVRDEPAFILLIALSKNGQASFHLLENKSCRKGSSAKRNVALRGDDAVSDVRINKP